MFKKGDLVKFQLFLQHHRDDMGVVIYTEDLENKRTNKKTQKVLVVWVNQGQRWVTAPCLKKVA